MKNIILFFLLFSYLVIAQDQSQSIELPDFVITGTELISVPKMQKRLPEFIALLSSDFFTPTYSYEDDVNVGIPNIKKETTNFNELIQNHNALLKLKAGIHVWPNTQFYYNDWIDRFVYSANIYGMRELEYIKNAGLNNAGISLNGKYFIDQSSKFLPGLEIGLTGNYFYESFKYFGSNQPNQQRITNNGKLHLLFDYTSDSNKKFGLQIFDNFYKQKDDNISENIFGFESYFNFNFKNINFDLNGHYENQSLNSNQYSFGNTYYFNSQFLSSFILNNIFNLKAGIYLAESNNNTFFAPLIFGKVKFNDALTFYGEFSPFTEFRTLKDFKILNRYYSINTENSFSNSLIENKVNLKGAIKYEYERFFEISLGLGYLNSDNNLYFEDNKESGFFTVYKDDIEQSYMFFNFLFRKGPFGEFYANLNFQNTKSSNGKKKPYTPQISAEANYFYNWFKKFGIKLGLYFDDETFSDFQNTEKISAKLNASASFYYNIFNNFNVTLDFDNLFNDKYYYFKNYEAKPFDVLLGFEFKW